MPGDVRATTVYVGLGSNLGDREAHLRQALRALAQVPGIEVVRTSSWRETEPVVDGPVRDGPVRDGPVRDGPVRDGPVRDGPAQSRSVMGRFLNGVAELRTTLPARALLGIMKALEAAAGRALPAPRNAPRPLDLDLLLFGDERIDTRDLVVPHPRWHLRAFVIEPLRELGLDVNALPRRSAPAVIDTPVALAAACSQWLAGGCTIGVVPTMGSLHAGHRSLIERARAECDRVVATIFVNPLQFGPGEDFAAYPRDLDGDLRLCRDAGADAVFAPAVAAMYPPEFCSHVAVGAAAEGMEGALRPGHFAGVATVVARLLAMVRPHRAYFGEKDAQQLAVVRRLVSDLGFPVRIVGCPIVREPDGLAMSSRNVYLGAADRAAATVLFRALTSARHAFQRGEHDRDRLLARVRDVIASEPRAVLDYAELRREVDLAELPPGPVSGGRLLVAARFNGGERPVRLLDNLALVEPGTA